VIIADTSGLLAFFNRREPAHEATTAILESTGEPVSVSPYVVAEIDYLVATRLGAEAAVVVLDALSSGAYVLDTIDVNGLRRATEIVRRYQDQEIGVADASLVVLAERHRTRTILTLDHRHFDVLRPLDGGRFKLVP
jgi:uncharacterized protein